MPTLTLKTCFKCTRELPLDEFYPHPMMADGRLGKCKRCTRLDVRANRERRREHYVEYDRQRSPTPERRAQAERYKQRNPEKIRAQLMVKAALENGTLRRQSCEVCGTERTDAHHDDYAQPLQVRWLCRTHHMRRHHTLPSF